MGRSRQASLEGSPTWEAAGAPGPADVGDGAPPLLLVSFQTSEEVASSGDARAVAGGASSCVSRGSPHCPLTPGENAACVFLFYDKAQWCALVRPRLGGSKRHD